MQATQYIRYVRPSQLSDIQTQLQKSLQNTFDCYSQPTNLMCNLGVPSIHFFRHTELTRLHYIFSNKPKSSLLYSVYMCRIHKPSQLDSSDLEAQFFTAQNKYSPYGNTPHHYHNTTTTSLLAQGPTAKPRKILCKIAQCPPL